MISFLPRFYSFTHTHHHNHQLHTAAEERARGIKALCVYSEHTRDDQYIHTGILDIILLAGEDRLEDILFSAVFVSGQRIYSRNAEFWNRILTFDTFEGMIREVKIYLNANRTVTLRYPENVLHLGRMT